MLVLDPAASGQLSLERLGPCSIKNVTYKTLNGKALEASIVTPRNLGPGSHPVMVRWHGGGLVNGHRLYVPWFARYLIQYIQRANAIMVLPDYRLLPGASGLDILEDMRDFFMWMFAGGLAAHLDDKVGADLHDILISGESAGGWLALQSAFTQGPRRIRAVVAHSPMIDMRDSHWTVPDRSKYLGGSSPTDIKDLAKFFGSEEKVTTFRMPPDGGEIYHCLVREGLYGKVFGDDRSLYPLELLEENQSLPPIWLVHSSADTIVPPTGTIKFAEKLRATASVPVHLTICDKGEHLFDVDIDSDKEWARRGLDFVEQFWPAK